MLQRRIVAAFCMGSILSITLPVQANNPAWEMWQPVLQPNTYSPLPPPSTTVLNCGVLEAFQLPNSCLRTNTSRNGLEDLFRYLNQPSSRNVNASAYPNFLLLETVQALLNWHDMPLTSYLADYFTLTPVSSSKGTGNGEFTGYYTPELFASRTPNARFRIPIYGKPQSNTNHFSTAEIANGALAGKGLEIAWTDDPYKLYVAQVQGSALLHFPDGSNTILDYAGNNNRPFLSVSSYLKQRNYKVASYSNDAIHDWLQAHPDKTYEVITSNPRYVFFRDTGNTPETASGHSVIPGHTVAVDSRYIPHGSILLAELPRFTATGQLSGTEWRLLFAQDHGKAIAGNGRFDLYTGTGSSGEARAYAISGSHRVFMLLRKQDALQRMAGL